MNSIDANLIKNGTIEDWIVAKENTCSGEEQKRETAENLLKEIVKNTGGVVVNDDLISRRAAIKDVCDLPNCDNGYSDTYDKACLIGLLEEQPTIDAVPVVRCKDCKWWALSDHNTLDIHICKRSYCVCFDIDFCSRAERSEE